MKILIYKMDPLFIKTTCHNINHTSLSSSKISIYKNKIQTCWDEGLYGGDLDIGNGALSNTSLDVTTPFTVLTISGVLLALRITLKYMFMA
jgi:hypothetical protein